MQVEIWKDIPGYEGLYQVSNLGRVKSFDRLIVRKQGNYLSKGKILKGFRQNNNYLIADLYNAKIRRHYLIHRLVAQAFIPNPNHYPQINHKDENKSNNCVENLEWVTAKQNMNYGTAINRRLQKTDYKKIGKDKEKYISALSSNGIKTIFSSLTKASLILKINIGHISEAANGKRPKAGGYKWEFVKNMKG
ncbi:NUMOD4 domain-containing protein [Oenococcus sicerae]|uniref:NUMOD4 domain-containing protein n=1 Tax=Oenococcus sicerae TaxID=2203724 RepID=UPI0039E82CCC